MKDTDNFFERMLAGVSVEIPEQKGIFIITPSMTAKQYAAIHLRVPRSGDPDIDAMIRESRRVEFAKQAVIGIAAKVYNVGEYKSPHVWGDIANEARIMADALIAELEPEEEK
jgi:hypothetical protein